MKFLSRGPAYTFLVTPSEATLLLSHSRADSRPGKPGATRSLRFELVGAKAGAEVVGVDELPDRTNYFIGNDPRKWRTNVPAFARVKVHDVYPGVDLIYYGNQQRLEYDFVLAPGADPRRIAMMAEGAENTRIDDRGDLVYTLRGGEVRFHRPEVYQTGRESVYQTVRESIVRRPVAARYVMHHHQVGIEVAGYDRSRPLVIDPVVTYSTYFGGDKDPNGQPAVTDGNGIAVDSSGNIYLAGTTNAVNDGVFPITGNARYPNPPNTNRLCEFQNVFVAKLDASGNRNYVTYLGGTQCNQGLAVAADDFGEATVTGWTTSADFPTQQAFQPVKPNPGNALSGFVTRFGATGALVYSSYISAGRPGSVAMDASGNAYLTGGTDSTFSATTTSNAYQTTCAAVDTYIVELSATGGKLYASCLASNTGGGGIAVDNLGDIYVAGGARAVTNFVVQNGFQTAVAGSSDAFVAKLQPTPSGTNLLYSTLFGGSQEDDVNGIAVDSLGNAWIAGNTGSGDLPVTTTAIRPACLPASSPCAAWVAKLDTTAVGLASRMFATYLGGSSGDDNASGVALDSKGNAYVGGFTASADFPILNSLYPCQACATSNESMFVTELSPTGTILFSTFLGGGGLGSDLVLAIAVDPNGAIYLTGETGSESLPPVAVAPPEVPIPPALNPLQPLSVGGLDAFVVRISGGAGTFVATTTSVVSSSNPSVLGQQVAFTASVTPNTTTVTVPTGSVVFKDGTSTLSPPTPLVNGMATFSTSSLSLGGHDITVSYGGDSNFAPSTSAVLIETVDKIATQVTLTAAPNPAGPGQTVTFNTTVSPIPPGVGVPTGSVTFLDGAATLGIQTLASGAATFGTATLSIGSHPISASYGGDASFAAGTSVLVVEQITGMTPTISKAFGAAVIVRGFSTSLSFTVGNPNPAVSLLGVGFIDNLPAGLVVATPSGQIGSCGGGVVSAISGSSTVSLTGATLPGSATCSFSVNVTGTAPGAFTNTTQNVTSSNGGMGNQASATLTVLPAVVLLNVSESITVTDVPQIPSVFINVSELIKVTDTDATYNTPTGSNIVVQPVDITAGTSPVTLTFSNVAQPGLTGLTTSTGGPPPPSGFQLGNPAVFYNLTTTATYTGAIQICINYTGISFQTPPGPRLFHFQSSAWVDVTMSVDPIKMIVCGSSTSLSPFGLFQSRSVVVPTTTSISAPGVRYGTPASVTVSVGSSSGTVTGSVALSVDGGAASTMTLSMASAIFNLGILSAGSHSLSAIFPGQGNFSTSSATGALVVAQERTSLNVTLTPPSIKLGESTTATVTLTAPDMVIPVDPGVLGPITLTSPVVSDMLSNNGICTPVPGTAPGVATCTVTVTAVEPNGRTLNASFAATTALAASAGTADLVVTAALQSQPSCIQADFHNIAVAGGNALWFNSIFKVRTVTRRQITISFFKSSVQFQYRDASRNLVAANQPMPDARIVIDPSVTTASTAFDAIDNVWITTIPFDSDDNAFLTGLPWLVPAGGIPGDVEPVTWCGTFASDTAEVDIGWRWAAAAYSSFSSDNTVLGVKPMDTDHDNSSTNRDRAGTPEQFKAFVIAGARGKGRANYTGTYSGSEVIE